MISLTLEEVLELHQDALEKDGGLSGIRDEGALLSAISQPELAMFGRDMYSTYPEKAAALGFSLINNHCFVDGNKRIGLLAMDVFLYRNGYQLNITTDEAETMALSVADSSMNREELVAWITAHIAPIQDE